MSDDEARYGPATVFTAPLMHVMHDRPCQICGEAVAMRVDASFHQPLRNLNNLDGGRQRRVEFNFWRDATAR